MSDQPHVAGTSRAGKPSPERIDQIRHLYLEPAGEWAVRRVERVMAAAGPKPGERVLDLACNLGTFSYHAFRAGARPVGVDRNPVALVEGRAIAIAVGGVDTPRVRGDALDLPFADGVFDLVINADFVEHVPDNVKRPICDEMYRVLRPGGRAVVYSPNLNKIRWELLGERVKRLVGVRTTPVPRWQDFVDPDHFGLTTPGNMIRVMRAAGFRTTSRSFDFHIPGVSRLRASRVFERLFAAQFSERYLVLGKRPE
jgi:SAM-dependent methyltransferase